MSYAFIELGKFNKGLSELKTEEDYWIFTLKEASNLREVPADAPEPIKQAYEILESHRWTFQERLAYEKARIALMDDLNAIDTARKEGKEEGMQARNIEIAKNMLGRGLELKLIQEVTGLSQAEVEKIACNSFYRSCK
jgi:predicted transposase/invertase (TIGR01784 family)